MNGKEMGSFLKELRKEKGYSQEELAERIGVTNRTVSRYETGATLVPLDILVELSSLYDVDVIEIINGRKENVIVEKEEVNQLVDYSCQEREQQRKMNRRAAGLGVLFAVLALVTFTAKDFAWLHGFCLGAELGSLLVVFFLNTKSGLAFRRWKKSLWS